MKQIKKYRIQNLKSNKGVTLMDVTIAAIFIAIFTGTIASLMIKTYNMALDIQSTSTANAYATIIMEKVDEKPFDYITNDFVNYLKDEAKELSYDSSYAINVAVIDDNITIYDYEDLGIDPIFKKVTVTVTYTASNNSERKIILEKLKVKEIK